MESQILDEFEAIRSSNKSEDERRLANASEYDKRSILSDDEYKIAKDGTRRRGMVLHNLLLTPR